MSRLYTLSPFELMFQDILKSTKNKDTASIDNIKNTLRTEALDSYNRYKPKLEQNLPPEEVEALKSLMNDETIIIQKSDKGNSVVILNVNDYKLRMKELLSDVSKFQKLNIKPGKDYNFIHNQELRIIELLNVLKGNGSISVPEYEQLYPRGSGPGILYGLSKVHKSTVNGIPKLRPILSAVNIPTYNLSKLLVKMLKPFTTNKYTPKDSFAFAHDVRQQDISLVMGSLDVDALFTNIPLIETIDICVSLLYKDKDVVNNISRDDFRKMLVTVTQDSFILFDGEYYKQTDGVAMGSPLGPTLANIFLGFHEQNWLNSCPTEFKPAYYARYVDDIFVLFHNPDDLVKFKEYMNNRHPNMHFTSETEENNTLPFLDINIIRDDNSFMSSVYRKKTFSGVYTNFISFLPEVYKFNLVSTLLFRAYMISSNWTIVHNEIDKLKGIMKLNGYPVKMVDSVIKRFLYKQSSPGQEKIKPDKIRKTIQLILPFPGSTSKKKWKKP